MQSYSAKKIVHIESEQIFIVFGVKNNLVVLSKMSIK